MGNKILITVDLEEFDLPLEYNQHLEPARQLEISTVGLAMLKTIIDLHRIPVTFFTTAFFAENNPQIIRELSDTGHEIASHLYYHSSYDSNHLGASRKKLMEITGKTVAGVRMPRMKKIEPALVREAGYLYDSSLNPTYLPGRYNDFFKPRSIFRDEATGLVILPLSVSPLIRFPLFWLSFKNIPPDLYKSICRQALKKDSYLHLYFHPWEFADLDTFKIPRYIKNISGVKLAERFDDLLNSFKSEAVFSTAIDFIGSADGKIPSGR
jgi:peptidoglycan/xylan/chitin deacetylase (PgdA/CDA1 family)